MDLVFSTCTVGMFTKDILLMVKKMELEKLLIAMEIHIVANGVKDKFLVMELSMIKKMIKVLKGFGKMENIVGN